MNNIGEAEQTAIDQAVKKHVGEAVGGLREDIAAMLKGRENAVPANSISTRCKVTGPGYTEQFTKLAEAQKAFNDIKKRLSKAETAGTVKLFSERAGSDNGRGLKWDLVQEWKANEDAFA
jgi:hypothetical protein